MGRRLLCYVLFCLVWPDLFHRASGIRAEQSREQQKQKKKLEKRNSTLHVSVWGRKRRRGEVRVHQIALYHYPLSVQKAGITYFVEVPGGVEEKKRRRRDELDLIQLNKLTD